MPKITVLMPVYNGEKYIEEAVESILGQTFKDYEFLIIDDASSDRSKDIILSYRDKRIRFMKNDKNLGQMATLNSGVRLARGEYIARMDQDDISLPQRLEKEAASLDKFNDLTLIYSDSFILDEYGASRDETLFDCIRPPCTTSLDSLLKRNFIIGNTVMVRRRVFDDIGLFNTTYRIAAEYDFFLRLARRYRIDFIDAPLAGYRVHRANSSRNAQQSVIETIKVLENTDRQGLTKDQQNILKRSISAHKTDLSMYYLFERERKKCSAEARAAIKINPFNIKAIAAIFMAGFFPDPIIGYVNSFRREWFR